MVYLIEDYALDGDRRELRRGSTLLAVEPQVFDLLVYLIENRDQVVSKEDMIRAVWGGRIVSELTLDSRINAARRAIGDNGKEQRLIRTIIGRGVRFVGAMREQPSGHAGATAPPPRLSIVVLPFANLSGDPEREYFVDAVTDNLTTDLSRIVNSFVIARTTAFAYKGRAVDVKQIGRELGVRYVLEGSVQQHGEQVQVNVQLIDAESGGHIWTDRIDTDRSHLPTAQSMITARLARALELELIEAVGRRIERDTPAILDARDLVMQGWAFFYRPYGPVVGTSLKLAQDAFEEALAKDPESVDARVGIAWVLGELLASGTSPAPAEHMARADRLLREALDRDRNAPLALAELGRLRRLQGRLEESLIELEKALFHHRNSSHAIIQSGITLLFLGRPKDSLPYLEEFLRINPQWQNLHNIYYWLGHCHLLASQLDEAITALRKGHAANPTHVGILAMLSAALGLRGDVGEAKDFLAASARQRPSTNSLRGMALHYVNWNASPGYVALRMKTIDIGLRHAGMPEE